MEALVLGGGCFWCTEAVFQMVKGIAKTSPGYAGGATKNPTYDEVCEGHTEHAEVLYVEYDPDKIKIEVILAIFFAMHDPTTLNRQGADIGTQYRSIILYTSDSQKKAIEKFIDKIKGDFDNKIVTEVKMLDKFYPAEEYHMNYFSRNQSQPYCNAVIKPKIEKIKKKFPDMLK